MREEKKGAVCTMSFFLLNFAAQKEEKAQTSATKETADIASDGVGDGKQDGEERMEGR